jgi:hypothetical protein
MVRIDEVAGRMSGLAPDTGRVMVVIAQQVEHQVVILAVGGSSPLGTLRSDASKLL